MNVLLLFSLNNILLKELIADQTAWEIVQFDEQAAPIAYVPPLSSVTTAVMA